MAYELLKSVFAWLLSPFVLGLGLQLSGFVLLRRRFGRFARGLVVTGTAVLLIGSLPVVTARANRDREYSHAPFRVTDLSDPSVPVLIAVLGSGFNPDPWLSAPARIDRTYAARLLEGIRIHRLLPNSRLLVTLPGAAGSVSEKRRTLRELATILRLDPERINLLTEPQSTADEAALAASHRRPGERVVVATSAAHMPRALDFFAEQGLDPVAAPADYRCRRPGSPGHQAWRNWIPSTKGLGDTEAWLYEWAAGFASH